MWSDPFNMKSIQCRFWYWYVAYFGISSLIADSKIAEILVSVVHYSTLSTVDKHYHKLQINN
jgi:hypothetical protein